MRGWIPQSSLACSISWNLRKSPLIARPPATPETATPQAQTRRTGRGIRWWSWGLHKLAVRIERVRHVWPDAVLADLAGADMDQVPVVVAVHADDCAAFVSRRRAGVTDGHGNRANTGHTRRAPVA